MKKTIYIATMILYNYIMTLLAIDTGMTTSGSALADTPDGIEYTLTFLSDVFKSFGDLLTFNVEGLPASFIVIFIYIPNLVLLIVLIGYVLNRDN